MWFRNELSSLAEVSLYSDTLDKYFPCHCDPFPMTRVLGNVRLNVADCRHVSHLSAYQVEMFCGNATTSLDSRSKALAMSLLHLPTFRGKWTICRYFYKYTVPTTWQVSISDTVRLPAVGVRINYKYIPKT